ncbi:alpha/beta fold hydrolase [Tsukamurella ocularis]|uniref:alpha/beta fold hydrolase n=1 Tax=Tsukamurella ocularis TaxID=1970234 RepID=UPI00216A357B|nr:alpha/beta hydrolase [Tsukamurella ocularis]MCS3780561.1 pimeloyl-ACP methyl ester carboxylesterase [Tsukamurella ocularis]MCS3785884.1 pimeloyl-ACP methyl ester carboxylesterase [Tsukamurella ocularis]MCS3849248.1 pimeloyl-ACP methyl ester carboxylesterase [Tsukamurella ocularis]
MGPRIRRAAVAGLAVTAVLVGTSAYLLRDPSPVGYWRSADARATYLERYDRALRDLPAPSEMRDVRTGYGIVRAYRFGTPRPGEEPILLVPGRSSGVPMWADVLGRLRDREVYAVDALGDAGMSVQDRPLADADDQAAWLAEAMTALGIRRAHLVGHSFGAWSAANLAVRHPDRVATLTLWEPILVFAGLRWQMYVATLPSALPFLPESWRRKGLASIGGADEADTTDSPIGAMIDAGAAGYRAALPTPVQPDDAALARLTMPVFVGLGGRSAVTDTAAAAERARTLPNATVRVWPDGTHSLPMEYPDDLLTELSALMA